LQDGGQSEANERQFDGPDPVVGANQRIVERVSRIMRVALEQMSHSRRQTAFVRVRMPMAMVVLMFAVIVLVRVGVTMAVVVLKFGVGSIAEVVAVIVRVGVTVAVAGLGRHLRAPSLRRSS
jgi:hypothetical protein